jgi:AcrR family transcriptional regulator
MTDLNPTAETLLKTAERLFALHGLDSVSTRQIAREAGQKNHSALQYHFGNQEGLIDAILVYRMSKVNEQRQRLKVELTEQGRLGEMRALVELIVRPFAEQLLLPPEESYYISLIAQLYSRHQAERVYQRDNDFYNVVYEASSALAGLMNGLGDSVLAERMRFMGSQMVHTVALWDYERREGLIELNQEALQSRIANLIDFLVGGLSAPACGKAQQMR